MTFTLKDKIGDIVTRLPKAAEVFKKYNIDFCCGGNRPLSDAISEQGIDGAKVLADLEQAYQKVQEGNLEDRDWQKAGFGELIDHIINKHHAYVRTALPHISELSTTILRVHGTNHPELSKVHRLFHTLKMELEQHLITEEEVLFPLVKDYEETHSTSTLSKALATVEQLEREHEGAGDILKELRVVTREYSIPEDACTTYELTYKQLIELESDLFQHIHLENNILHPRLAKLAGR